MKVSENWLREWANPELDTEHLVAQLTMAGLEVDSVEAAAPDFSEIVVAEVSACDQHPDADRLKLCQVHDGNEQPLQVICGAANVRAGLKVAFARVGAELAGMTIKKAKLRGIESNGMICSEQELQMADTSDGILELPDDAPVGTALSDYLQINDNLIEIDLTPNRGDCLSIAGVAREVAANNDITLTPVSIEDVPPQIDDTFTVELINQQACPRYVGRIIRGINAAAETPLWIKEKLRRCGLRPISPVVDVTNYVMMELGQPMHGFDFDKLHGGIRVRNAQAGEKIALLDGSELECRDDTLLIADHQNAVAVAGIMGGLHSSVQEATQNVFLEAAFFSPQQIAGKARSYGMHTDSSHRFERGVDSGLQVTAMHRATALVTQIMGGTPGPVIEQKSSADLPINPHITLRHHRVERLLGLKVSRKKIEGILHELEMEVTEQAEDWVVKAPSYRFDINIEADLIEEIGRIIGYNHIPGTKEAAHSNMDSFSETRSSINQLRDVLVTRGYYEAINYSFVSPQLQNILDPGQKTLTLSNPISSDMSEMRTRLLPGLIQSVRYNLNRQQSRIRLFETGLCFIPHNSGLDQRTHLAAVICGPGGAESWTGSNPEADFYDIKGDLESLIQLANKDDFEFRKTTNEILHPGQSADIYYQGSLIGFIGLLHPSVLKELDIDEKLFVFELETDGLLVSNLPEFRELSRFPVIRRDLALVLEQKIEAHQLINSIKSLKSEIIQDVFIFDVYTGMEVIKSRKSVALGLILQDFSRTLTDQDVEKTVGEVLKILKKHHKAVLR